jgi:hypothetical protein
MPPRPRNLVLGIVTMQTINHAMYCIPIMPLQSLDKTQTPSPLLPSASSDHASLFSLHCILPTELNHRSLVAQLLASIAPLSVCVLGVEAHLKQFRPLKENLHGALCAPCLSTTTPPPVREVRWFAKHCQEFVLTSVLAAKAFGPHKTHIAESLLFGSRSKES